MNTSKKQDLSATNEKHHLLTVLLYGIAALLLVVAFGWLILSSPAVYAETTDSTNLSLRVGYTLSNPKGILAEQDNGLKVNVENNGGLGLSNAELRLILPEEVKIYSGTIEKELGYFAIGGSKWAEFHLTAHKKTKSKTYLIQIQVSGTDQTGSTQTVSKTVYIPVIGTDASESFSMSDISITAVSLPAQAMSGDSFELAFAVRNNGTKNASDLKVTVEPGEGLLNRTGNVFLEPELKPGASKNFKVTLFSLKDAAEKNYPIKILVEPTSLVEGDDKTPISQYMGILLTPKDSEKDGVKTPRLMVSSYSYGGSSVRAGSTFSLGLNLLNTSGKELRNIQVTLSSADGAFVPSGTGNTFFIDRLEAKSTLQKSVSMHVKMDAEQKTTPLEVEMIYEDGKSNEFSAKSTISIPVTQEERLVINDVVAPPELYAGMQSGVSVDFYNMGKSILRNLRMDVSGNFDAPQSNAYFVGNMEPGKSDSYDFAFMPRDGAPVEGVITFTYEDSSGKEHSMEKPFQFTVMEQVPWEDPGMMEPPPEEKKISWAMIGAIAGSVLVLIVGLIWRKRRKRNRELQLEMEE